MCNNLRVIANQTNEKPCSKCGEVKPLEAFARNPNGKYGRHAHCKACHREFYVQWAAREDVKQRRADLARVRYQAEPERGREFSRRYREKYPEKLRETARKNHLRYYYGLTVEDYAALLAAQGGVCAICGGPPNGRSKTRYHVDHDHDSKRVRGLLCHDCNTGIALFERRPELLARVMAYLTADILATTDVRTEQEGDAGDDAAQEP